MIKLEITWHDFETDFVGIFLSKKCHEIMCSEDDANHTFEYNKYYVIASLIAFHVVVQIT